MQYPKYLTSHPAVALVTTAEAQGSDADEYKWYVELKAGWVIASGRNAGGTSLFLNRRDEFEVMSRAEWEA
jgi:hypothetical protein